MIYLATILVFLFMVIFLTFLLFSLFIREKPIEKLSFYDLDYIVQEKKELKNKKRISIIKLLSKLVPRLKINKKRIKKLEEELIKADIPITVEELFIIKLLSSFSFAFLVFSLSKDIIISILIIVFVWYFPKIIILKRKSKRIKIFNEQLIEGIVIISNSLKAGYSFLQAITVVVEETKDPFSKEFKKMLKEMSLGISTEDALKGMINRVDSDDLTLIANAILIQNDIGGNLSEILDNISETIRDRQKIQNELKTLTAQGKMSGTIVTLMPIFLGIIIYLFSKEYMLLLFNTRLGLTMIIGAFVSQIIGIVIINKIIKIEI